MTVIREWRNNEWEKSSKGREQSELQFMFKKIMENADDIENKPTPGSNYDDLSRCIICKSSIIQNIKYVIHVNGFTVEDITEIEKR